PHRWVSSKVLSARERTSMSDGRIGARRILRPPHFDVTIMIVLSVFPTWGRRQDFGQEQKSLDAFLQRRVSTENSSPRSQYAQFPGRPWRHAAVRDFQEGGCQ